MFHVKQRQFISREIIRRKASFTVYSKNIKIKTKFYKTKKVSRETCKIKFAIL